MNNAVDNKPVSRVLIALDAMQENPGALETAIALAAQRQSELMMLFIEDMNLVNLAGLPFASEID
ncbi:MAG: universal stress protein UspA, partial [Gammaproteobacteria bacterium]|nr:universal stress protein UspA [Gammaproteobacteria bacterium]